jgi:hypothetical protein
MLVRVDYTLLAANVAGFTVGHTKAQSRSNNRRRAGLPSILISYGLGKELGAVPTMAPGSGLAAKFISLPSPSAFLADHKPCN